MTTGTLELRAISRSHMRATPGMIGVVVSLLYFGDLFLKASRKCFWYDELFTVYLCRLPSFKHTWAAVMQGGDYNPPVLYLLTRAAERVFGEGLIATRLPEMVGVWLFGICLYLFVSRRAGRLSGLIAALLPFFTIVQYYAYEARPHGITLAWAGLALICWQRSHDGEGRFLWPLGFGLSLTGALLTHVYDVYLVLPFAAVELYYLAKDRRMSWPIASAIALPLIGVLPLYLSLVRMYRATVPPTFAPASHSVLRPYFTEAMSPAIVHTPACHRASCLGWKAPIEISRSHLSHSAAGDPPCGTFCLHSPSWVGGRHPQPWPLSPPLFPVGHRRLRNSPRLRKFSKLS